MSTLLRERTFGRLQAIDERDKAHSMRALAPPPPPTITRKYWVPGQTLDQGPFPHCVGYAWAGWLQCSPVRTIGGPLPPDIYTAAQLVDEWPGEGYAGTSVRAGAKVMQAQNRIGEYVWASSLQELQSWILTKGPVVMGTEWYECMSVLSVEGYARPLGAKQGGHAYLCIGYSTTRHAFRFLNSWGRGWGLLNGRFWMHEEDVAALLITGEACAAVEVKVGS